MPFRPSPNASALPPHPDDRDLPGASLFEVAKGTARRRTILSEYHATGAATGAFMIRKGRFKYVYYAGMPPQLFDLEADPQETRDLAREAGYAGLVADCEALLRRVVDPDAADALAKADQRRAHRRVRRPRGDPEARQLRLFAGAGYNAGLQLNRFSQAAAGESDYAREHDAADQPGGRPRWRAA